MCAYNTLAKQKSTGADHLKNVKYWPIYFLLYLTFATFFFKSLHRNLERLKLLLKRSVIKLVFFFFCFLSCVRKWKSRTMSKLVVFLSKLNLLNCIDLLEITVCSLTLYPVPHDQQQCTLDFSQDGVLNIWLCI